MNKLAIFLTCALISSGLAKSGEPVAFKAKEARVELVFVLDTTASMRGLIQTAKDKIWGIANTLATSESKPQLKIGLVGYRDREDQYVTKVTDLTNDIDAVYTELMTFKADGGGDGPESVNQALSEGINKISWTKEKDVYRVIFLVGDQKPHMDYQDDIKYPETCKLAKKKGIIINTILCGNNIEADRIWKDIALRSAGKSFKVNQNGGSKEYRTVFDKELVTLSQKMDQTKVFFGNAKSRALWDVRAKQSVALNKKAKQSSLAQRSLYNCTSAGKANFIGSNDLVDSYAQKKSKLKDLKKENLPKDLQNKSTEELKSYLDEKIQMRKEIQKTIIALAKKRQKDIQAQIAKEKTKGKDSFEQQVFKSIQAQAKENKVIIKGGPKL